MTTLQCAITNKVTSPINVSLTDFILTPISCAWLVNEIMKNLLYQRSQIPYPYTWLKSIITKKRQSMEKSEKDNTKNFTINRHYQVVSRAFDSAESVMANMIKAFSFYGSKLKEIVFMIGVSPVCPKEIFTIKIPVLASGHVERNHLTENSKKQAKILRGIFLEQEWMNLIESALTCTNTYVFLKLSGNQNISINDDSIFVSCKPISFPPKVKHTVICLEFVEHNNYLCCDKLEVFRDCGNSEKTPQKISYKNEDSDSENSSEEFWLQSKVLIQGFKDCFINKVSACELW